jgi:hypothetical protein
LLGRIAGIGDESPAEAGDVAGSQEMLRLLVDGQQFVAMVHEILSPSLMEDGRRRFVAKFGDEAHGIVVHGQDAHWLGANGRHR